MSDSEIRQRGLGTYVFNPLRTSQGEVMMEGKIVTRRDGLVKCERRVGSAFHGMQNGRAVEEAALDSRQQAPEGCCSSYSTNNKFILWWLLCYAAPGPTTHSPPTAQP